jgi:hypothetical protein
MGTLAKLFCSLLAFVYRCFDRIVINGYLSGSSRPEQVVHFVRKVLGIPVVGKEVLSQRTNDYQNSRKPSPAIAGFRIECGLGKAFTKRMAFCLRCAAWRRG